jgi:hypothetical protein
VFGVVALGRREINGAQIRRHDAQLFVFEATDDLADEAARHTVGLHDEECSVHDEAI